MNVKRQLAVAALLGTGIGLTGCQSASLGGLAFWKKDDSAIASSSPDGSQKYEGLSKQFASKPSQPMGQPRQGTSSLGGPKPASDDNFVVASWKKTTAAVGGVFAARPTDDGAQDDPLRLDNPVGKVGPEIHVAAARLLENQQKFDEAEQHYNKALTVAPNNVSALVGLARLHDRQSNSAKALELYHQAIKADPSSGLAYNDLGLCLARQKQFDKSIQALGQAVRLQSDNPKYRNNLATVLVEAGHADEAFKQLAITNSPAVAHYNVGYLLKLKGDTGAAMRHLQQALALDPTLEPAREMLAQLGGGQNAAPLNQAPPPQMATRPEASAANTYGSGSYGFGSFGAGSPVQTAAAPSAPANVGGTFHISDDASPADPSGYYGGPRHLPPIQ